MHNHINKKVKLTQPLTFKPLVKSMPHMQVSHLEPNYPSNIQANIHITNRGVSDLNAFKDTLSLLYRAIRPEVLRHTSTHITVRPNNLRPNSYREHTPESMPQYPGIHGHGIIDHDISSNMDDFVKHVGQYFSSNMIKNLEDATKEGNPNLGPHHDEMYDNNQEPEYKKHMTEVINELPNALVEWHKTADPKELLAEGTDEDNVKKHFSDFLLKKKDSPHMMDLAHYLTGHA
jgi:hypothetical protein